MKSSMIDEYIKLIENDMSKFLEYSLSKPNYSEGYSGYIIDLLIEDVPNLYVISITEISKKRDVKAISSNKNGIFRDFVQLTTSTYVKDNLKSDTRSLELSYGQR